MVETKGNMAAARRAVREAGVADTVGRLKNGDLIARHEFFYTHGYTAERFAGHVEAALKDAGFIPHIVESGEVWKPFRGGASTANSSHWYVVFWVE